MEGHGTGIALCGIRKCPGGMALKGGIGMDIAGLSTALSMSSTQSKISIAVLSRELDTNRELGQGMVEMIDAAAMEQSVYPGLGGNIDIRV